MTKTPIIVIGLAVIAMAAAVTFAAREAEPRKPTVVLTFDEHYSTVSTAFPIMKEYGLVGTYFVDPRHLDTQYGPSSAELKEMERNGWEIGAYSVLNIPRLIEGEGADAAREWLSTMKDFMTEKGFSASSLAAAQRTWGAEAKDAASPHFVRVRVADEFALQPMPVPDPRYVRLGGSPSLSSSTTVADLAALLDDLVEQGGVWFVVVHKVGDHADPTYSVPTNVFSDFVRAVAGRVRAREIEVQTFARAVGG